MALSLLNYENSLFQIIIGSSITLSIISIFIMIGIIICKIRKNFIIAKTDQKKQNLSKILYVLLNNKNLPIAPLPQHTHKLDRKIIFEIALNIFRGTQGVTRQRLLKILETYQIDQYAEKLLSHGSRGKKIQALALLSHFPTQKISDIFLKFINDKDKYIQLAALYGLATKKAFASLPEVTKILLKAEHANTLMLTDVLVKFGEPATPYLIELALSDQASLEIRLTAVKALGRIGSLAAVEPLLILANAANFNLRAQSLLALAQLGDIRAADVILQRLHDREAAVRVQAAKAAGSLKIDTALLEITNLLKDDSWWVQYRAAEALYALGSRGLAALNTATTQSGRCAEIARQFLQEKEILHE